MSTKKIGITANCAKILRRLAEQNYNTGQALHNQDRRLWSLMNYDLAGGTGVPTFDAGFTLSMADAKNSKVHELFDRQEATENYEKAHEDDGENSLEIEKSTHAVVAAKAQIDILNGLEAGYRARYMTSRLRNMAHNAARVRGHSLEEGAILKDIQNWIISLGTPPAEKDADA
tara:strand:+ start:541 stop:1059 length:519 start_codon:yes stop_codon:yes gene_type:complete